MFRDEFVVGSNTDLLNHTPTVQGDEWVVGYDYDRDSDGLASFVAVAATNSAGNTNGFGTNTGVARFIRPAPVLSEYIIEYEVTAIRNTTSSTAPLGALFRFANGVCYQLLVSNGTGTPRFQLFRRTGPSSSTLLVGETDPPMVAVGDVHRIECEDGQKRVYRNDTLILSTNDNAASAAGEVGPYIGGNDWISFHADGDWRFGYFDVRLPIDPPAKTVGISHSIVEDPLRIRLADYQVGDTTHHKIYRLKE